VPGVGEDVKLGGDFRGLVFQVEGRQPLGKQMPRDAEEEPVRFSNEPP
jgi:hypothetical protein